MRIRIGDDIAQAIAHAPILDRLEVLDLSQGIISDVGAEALLASPKVNKVEDAGFNAPLYLGTRPSSLEPTAAGGLVG